MAGLGKITAGKSAASSDHRARFANRAGIGLRFRVGEVSAVGKVLSLQTQNVRPLRTEHRPTASFHSGALADDRDSLLGKFPLLGGEQGIRDCAAQMIERLRRLPQLVDVASDLQDKGQQAYVEIDRAAAGLSLIHI